MLVSYIIYEDQAKIFNYKLTGKENHFFQSKVLRSDINPVNCLRTNTNSLNKLFTKVLTLLTAITIVSVLKIE